MALNETTLLNIQSKRGAKIVGAEVHNTSKEAAINECRKFIRDNSIRLRELDPVRKREKTRELIINYIKGNPPRIKGYTDGEGRPDINKLIDLFVQEIMNYGILTRAMTDPTINEIRVNGREIKVEEKGDVVDLKDENGNIVRFESLEQQETVFRKIMGDVRLNPKYAVVNARTDEGYRVAALHHTALSPDPLDPSGVVYNAMVLRKFKQSKLGLNDIVKFGTLSDNMARTLAVLPAGGLTFFTVGPTASGKTTLNNAILQAVPADTRTVLLQNPSEIDLHMREKITNRVYNDVLHLEAREVENPSPTDPTMPNMMAHILRLSPTFVCFGEIRTNKEFKLAMQIAQAGHPMNATYHAEDAEGAITRYLTAYLAESGNEPAHLALQSLVSVSHLVIVQKILRDGTRKVIQITEILGTDPQNPNKPHLQDLYRFEILGEPEYNDAGKVIKIKGEHKRVGRLSDRLIKKLKLEGIKTECFDFLTKPVDPNEVETYTGTAKLSLA